MNSEHMVAVSEVNKRQDFTIKYVQGRELINTEFKHRNLVPGISEVAKVAEMISGIRNGLEHFSDGFVGVMGCNTVPTYYHTSEYFYSSVQKFGS